MTHDEHPDRPAPHDPNDPLPDPEPAVPSLPGPDLGVYHHEPQQPEKPGSGDQEKA